MNKQALWFILAMTCATLGCRHATLRPEAEVKCVSYRAARTAAEPEPTAGKDRLSTPTGASAQKVLVMQPRVGNVDTVKSAKCIEAGVRVAETRESADGLEKGFRALVREVSGAVAALDTMPKSLVSILASARIPQNRIEKESDADEALLSHQSRPPSVFETIWYFTAPIWSAMCAYIIAPLVVDLLKRRIQFSRRHPETRKPVQTA